MTSSMLLPILWVGRLARLVRGVELIPGEEARASGPREGRALIRNPHDWQ